MKYIVSVSGGAGSTLALERTIKQHGVEQTIALFADTNTEDSSLYALLHHMQAQHPALRFEWLHNDGRDIWDVFDEYGIIRTPTGACKASLELKQKPLAACIAAHYAPEEAVLVSGLEYAEPGRRARFDARWEPYACWHPHAEAPILSACQITKPTFE